MYDKVWKVMPNPLAIFEFQKEQWAEYYIRNFQSAFKPDVNIEELSEEEAMYNLPELRNQEIELQIE